MGMLSACYGQTMGTAITKLACPGAEKRQCSATAPSEDSYYGQAMGTAITKLAYPGAEKKQCSAMAPSEESPHDVGQ